MNKKYEKNRPAIPADIKRAVKTRASHTCTIPNCQEMNYLEIHHINKNREKNSIDNLILLCGKHHKLVHDGVIDRKELEYYLSKLDESVALGKSVRFVRSYEVDRILVFIEWLENIVCINDDGRKLFPEITNLEKSTYEKMYRIDMDYYFAELRSFDPEVRGLQDEMLDICFSVLEFYYKHEYIDLWTTYKLKPNFLIDRYDPILTEECWEETKKIMRLEDLFELLKKYCHTR